MQTLFEFFAQHVAERASLVLATVVSTEGSTYSKTGERLLVDGAGRYRGLLSGGCLEGDLALRARQVLDEDAAQMHRYDMRGDDDLLFGMGVGCEGAIDVLLQPLHHRNHYAPFAAVVEAIGNERRSVLAISLSQESLGDSLLVSDQGECTELGMRANQQLVDSAMAIVGSGRSSMRIMNDSCQSADVLLTLLSPAPRLLALGGGPDVIPLVRMGMELGWRSTIVDHRPAYIESLPSEFDARVVLPSALSKTVRVSDYDRAIVMSHHLETDRSYLQQLADSDLRYIGLLGPPARRDRLLAELAETRQALESRLFGPAGLDLQGRGAAPIALSILAEMQQVLADD